MRAHLWVVVGCVALLTSLGEAPAVDQTPAASTTGGPTPVPTATVTAGPAVPSTSVAGPAAKSDLDEILKRLQEIERSSPGFEGGAWNLVGESTPERQLHLLRLGVTALPEARQRTVALNALVALHPEALAAVLVPAAPAEKDPALRAAEVLLLGMTRDPAVVPALRAMLKDSDARVRAAAADALGIVRQPTYLIAITRASDWVMFDVDRRKTPFGGNAAITFTDPPIVIESLIRLSRYGTTHPKVLEMDHQMRGDLKEVPAEVRDELMAVMMGGKEPEEREAAARALVAWPPAKYQFRLAEWGVWIANDGGDLVLPQSVLNEIPPFVHRTGNPVDALADRVNRIMFITKPILHLTTNQAMAVDLEVRIEFGRPFVAYPKPDDFCLAAATQYGWLQAAEKKPEDRACGDILEGLNPKDMEALKDLREGYPWLWPNHRRYGAVSGGMGAAENVVTGMGLRWQSLIVNPKAAAWMKPPEVPKKPAYAWWSALREVPSGWVSSRGESERFVYYDGPTLARTPVRVSLRGDTLTFDPQAMIPDDLKKGLDGSRAEAAVPTAIPGVGDKEPPPRTGAFIRVVEGKPKAWVIRLPKDEKEVQLVWGYEWSDDAAPEAVERLAVEGGLTKAEAAGLVAAWREHWFSRNGQRFLLRLTHQEYNSICPLFVRPVPTEGARLGLVMTEFADTPPR